MVIDERIVELICEQTANKILAKLKDNEIIVENTIFLDRRQVAKIIGVSLVTLNEYCRQGIIPSYRIGRRVLFKQSEIEEAVEKGLRYSHNRKGGVK